jgi:hypothetical protein
MAYDRNAPNASHYSARYADRKRAAERARLALPAVEQPCPQCGALVPTKDMNVLCATHREVYAGMTAKLATGEATVDDCMAYLRGAPVAHTVQRA